MPTFLYDLRHAARTLRHHPGFLTVVVVTLGFGIGINTATFSIVDAVLIRPLAFDEPERLMALQERLSGSDLENAWEGGEDHALLATFPADHPLPDGFRLIGRVIARADAPVLLDGRVHTGRTGWDPYRDWDSRSG